MPTPFDLETREVIQKRLDGLLTKKRASSPELDELLEAEARWLLLFGESELASDTNWDRLAIRVHRCALRLFGNGQVWPSSVLAATETGEGGVVRVPGLGAIQAEFPPFPPEAEIRAIHVQLREILHALWPRSGETAKQRIPLPAGIQCVHLSNDGKEIRRIYGANWPDWFWVGIAALLEEFGSHIERCQAPDCGRLFLRIRRQSYCSAECSQRVRSRRWYEAHRDEARERRREAYEKEVRIRSYARAKVQRRKGRAK